MADDEDKSWIGGVLQKADDYWLGGQGIKDGILKPAQRYWFGDDKEEAKMDGALEEINVIPRKRLPERIPGGPRDPRGGPALSLPASPNAPGRATPASSGAGGGAGNPMQMFESADPESILTSAETAAKTTAATGATADPKAAEQKKMINESMAQQGMDPVKGYEELRDQFMNRLEGQYSRGEITKKQHTKLKDRWKNIFNVVPKEDFGLFLMDFGLRLAAHSADNSFGGAFGQAGLGALGGAQERQRYKQEKGMEREQQAHERAMDVTKLGMEDRRGRALEKYYEGIGAASRAQQTIDTNAGLIQYNTETQEWEPVEVEGERVRKSYAGERGYQGEKFWLEGRLSETGMSQRDINNYLLGAKTPQERAQVLQDQIGKLKEGVAKFTTSNGQEKYFRNMTPAEEQQWIIDMMNAADAAAREYESQRRGGALPE